MLVKQQTVRDLVQQHGEPVLCKRHLVAARLARSHIGGMIFARAKPPDERLREMLKVGSLPAHHESWLISRKRVWQALIQFACGARVPGVGANSESAHVNEFRNGRFNLRDAQQAHRRLKVSNSIERSTALNHGYSHMVHFRTKQVSAVPRRIHPALVDLSRIGTDRNVFFDQPEVCTRSRGPLG